ncbi:amino acid adenylation domain-containing protein [Streptomyces sp. NPDC059913]|uniref:non-ribosomal peptide synthetase n=1 Tax=unclassified Streptomyces TaxID=2593676 RepID=UPI003656D947
MNGETLLSLGQERIWLLEQLNPGTAVDHIVVSHEVRGALDEQALRAAFHALADRHEPLRTAFHSSGGVPHAEVHPDSTPEFTVFPVADVAEALEHAAKDIGRPFDLAAPGLMRTALYEVAEEHHILVTTFHHLVTDGRSVGVFTRELGEAYGAFTGGHDWEPKPLATDYRTWLTEERATDWDPALAYWREALDGAAPLLGMPVDRARPPRPSYRAHRATTTVGGADVVALRTLAREYRVSPTMVLAAAWAAVLHRHGGQDNVVVGMPVSGRDAPELDGLIGLFMNVLPIRVRLEADLPFAELLRRVRKTFTEGLEHRKVPFAKIVAELRPERNLSYAPVFQTTFNHGSSGGVPVLGDALVEPVYVDSEQATAELELIAVDQPDGESVALTVICAADIFDPDTAGLLLAHFRELLLHAVAAPDTAVGRLEMADAQERARTAGLCAAPPAEVPTAAGVIDLVEAQCARTPDAPAVTDGHRTLTYRELDALAERVAAALLDEGVDHGDVVALHLDRSVAMLVAMLAVWKAGATYLPVDPGYPRGRTEFVLADSGARLVVATEEGAARLSGTELPVVTVEEALDHPGGLAPPERPADAETPAYLIYTSGSTGRPKGVLVPHRAVINFLTSMAKEPGLAQDDVVLALTSPSFDIAVLELFLPLTVGARLVVADATDATDPRALAGLVRDQGVTTVQATPITWRHLVEELPEGTRLRRALCGGEAVGRDLANALCGVADEVWNMYGPTETTVWSLCARLSAGEPGEPVPMGRPIANTSVSVRDAGLGIQPVGVVGELCIGGAGVALGYLDHPELTAERFPGGALYRTGDLARMRSDGSFEFLGRSDGQVKVRGHRIELEEIGSVLRRHPKVRDAVVVTRPDGLGGQRLVAYVVAKKQGERG